VTRLEGRGARPPSALTDDPLLSFSTSAAGVERLFPDDRLHHPLVHQMKTITDAAVGRGVSFIVHSRSLRNGFVPRIRISLARARRT